MFVCTDEEFIHSTSMSCLLSCSDNRSKWSKTWPSF